MVGVGFHHFLAAMVLGPVDTLSDDGGPPEPQPKAKGKAKSKASASKSKPTPPKKGAEKSETEVSEVPPTPPKPPKGGSKGLKRPAGTKDVTPLKRPAAATPNKRPAAKVEDGAGGSPSKRKKGNQDTEKDLQIRKYMYHRDGTYGYKVAGRQVMTAPRLNRDSYDNCVWMFLHFMMFSTTLWFH